MFMYGKLRIVEEVIIAHFMIPSWSLTGGSGKIIKYISQDSQCPNKIF